MHVLKTNDYVTDEKLGLFFRKKTFVSKMVTQITTIKIIHDEIKMFAVLEGIGHVNQEWMGESCQKFFLIHY